MYLPLFSPTFFSGNDSLKLDLEPIDNGRNLSRQIDLEPLKENIDGYETWHKRNVSAQKQEGLFSIKLPLHLGDLDCEDCFKLEKILEPFGDNVLRCTTEQNLYIRNIPEKLLKNIYKGLKDLHTLSEKPVIYQNFVPCTGAQKCQIGINYPRPAIENIFSCLEKTGLDLDKLDDMKIRISGCPNSCANHWIGDFAFFGKVRWMDGRPLPTYNVLGGGGVRGENGKISLGETVGWVHAYDLPRFITEVLRLYLDYRSSEDKSADFNKYWKARGKNAVSNLCETGFNKIPAFNDDKNYYFDHGAENIFSIKGMGKAECSAGIYDMIDVDDRAVKKRLKRIESWEKGKQGVGPVLKETVFFASRMLKVTRGEEPRTEQETYDLFIRLFIETGLVDKTHRFIVELVKNEKYCELEDHKDKAVALGKDVTALYKGMDSTMRFPGETENLAIRMEEKLWPKDSETEKPKAKPVPSDAPGEKKKPDRFKDLRGVRCPLNFAQTKVQIAGMKQGETLEVILDEGEPIENVPGSVKLDGHIILNQEKIGDHWTVLIEKMS